jgi:hypothetical protein
MVKELMISKMFWLIAAVAAGLILGGVIKRITGSKQSGPSLGIPVAGVFLTVLILIFVKLNVTYFDVKYTLMGIGAMLAFSLILGYVTYASNNKKVAYINNVAFLYLALSITVFYIFFKDELKVNTTQCPEEKDVYLLLKKENSGYYEINPDGIGYVGIQLFTDGFRPVFEKAGVDNGKRSHVPVAVELSTRYGVAHALWFRSAGPAQSLNLDSLISNNVVNASELWLGDLNKKDQ